MTQDEIIEMARRAGLADEVVVPWSFELHYFVKLVAEAERKECAKVAEEWVRAYPHPSEIIANKIRERGQQ